MSKKGTNGKFTKYTKCTKELEKWYKRYTPLQGCTFCTFQMLDYHIGKKTYRTMIEMVELEKDNRNLNSDNCKNEKEG